MRQSVPGGGGIGLSRLSGLSRLFRLFRLFGLFRLFRPAGLSRLSGLKKTGDCQVFGARFPKDSASGDPCPLPRPASALIRPNPPEADRRSKSWKIEAPPPCLRQAGRGRQASRSERRSHPAITCLESGWTPGQREQKRGKRPSEPASGEYCPPANQNGHHGSAALPPSKHPRIQQVPEAVAQQVEAQHSPGDGKTREEGHPGRRGEEGLGLV